MRVLHIQKVRGIGGSERHLLTLLPALQEIGCAVSMIALKAGSADVFIQQLQERGIDVEAIPAGPDINPLAVAQLRSKIKRVQPDIVHTHLIHANLHGQLAARLASRPGVVSLHSEHSLRVGRAYRWATAIPLRSADHVIAISRHVRDIALAEGFAPAEKVSVIHYGIDTTSWEREDLPLVQRQQVTVGISGRLIEGKGHPWLFESVAMLRSRGHRLHLQVAGAGDAYENLVRMVDELDLADAVTFLGHVADVEAFMADCDIIVVPTLPALSEGFGLSALEGMAAGKPVVASRVGALPEIVEHDVSGLLVEPGDLQDLADAILMLSEDANLRHSMAKRGRARARELFSVDEMTRSHIDVYEAVLAV